MGSIAVTGSVAYDTIMVFGGRFADHILSDQAHILNVSFLIDRIDKRRGGTAANIAYTLALLGERPLLCAAVGNDFAEYGAALSRVGVDSSRALLCDDIGTATAFITTDLDDNQITAFFPGAMARAAGVNLEALSDVEHVVVAPDAPDGMALHVEQATRMGARLVFAPAQQLSSLTEQTLTAGLDAAWMVVGNDYELEVIHRRTGRDVAALAAGGAVVARTRGGQGSELYIDGTVHHVPVAAAASVVDPTGAGDAYIAGLLAGLRAGRPAAVAGRMGALAATYVIEQQGPQSHTYTWDDFATRYAEAFGEKLLAP
ncbi:MAG: carbohydrate kinase family protein [Candidatus Dormibacteraeota bacterium]|nr:carbohydrate kinase family protein [Candidatus Dormibacteraeota bacterium]